MLLYLHIPFCHRVCPYCSFYKNTPGATPIGGLIDALTMEAGNRLGASVVPPRTIYLGGGTPSMLSPRHLTRLFAALHDKIDFRKLDEVTLEANPATFDGAKARLLRELGVTRVSLGIQSFSPPVLESLGREHSAAQAMESVAVLRAAGMPQVNIDLMFSVPGQSAADWESTLRTACETLRRGDAACHEDIDARLFHLADAILTSAGFEHYETSNYALPGRRSAHNQGYWRGEDYLGLGPSAVSTLGSIRSTNIADTARYIAQIHALGHALADTETLDAEARRLERIALGLRTTEGIPLELLDSVALQRAEILVGENLARIADGRLILIHRGRALVDPIAAELV
ncbi:MAG: coproporphyrinogen-III oxidase family protein [Verrucomicrobia bacterium]|nr:coproporphyrinogen-III oxidase family protein [Verrucomicrobiota bacterium]